jgi:hypothetical protein
MAAPVALLALAACGPSSALARKADRAVYETEFARVWNAVAATVKQQYPRVVIEDPIHGKILTDWHLVERVQDDAPGQSLTNAPSSAGGSSATSATQVVQSGRFFRVAVLIKPGGPPWKVEVDGEAALFTPGMAMLTPYDHDDADEPTWVKPRIDKIKVGIYEKLAGVARIVEEAPKAKPEPIDRSAWANLPAGAPDAIAQVAAAARARDADALRRYMISDFAWSEGGAPSADTAISLWRADPLVLAQLARTLDAGCAETEKDARIVCPADGAATGWHAEFRKQSGMWRFAAFYQPE